MNTHIKELLIEQGVSPVWASYLDDTIVMLGILLVAYLLKVASRLFVNKILHRIIAKTKSQWDDLLFKRKVFQSLEWLVPLLSIYILARFVDHHGMKEVLSRLSISVFIFSFLVLIQRFLMSVNDIFNLSRKAKQTSIVAYIQLVIVLSYFVGILSIIAILMDKSPWKLLGGLGAFAAVLIIVFKDSILGLIASIQLSANNLVSVGDWITIDEKKIDGTVIEVTLNNIKIQNWDKTISSVPTYYLVSESFINWKGMEESGGRRVKRHINLDMNSIKFLEREELEELKSIKLLAPYIKEKEAAYYQTVPDKAINQKRLTNLGLFRKYAEEYLKAEPRVHNDMTFIVRQLQSSEKGLPLEIYIFSNQQEWVKFEEVQSDIFDHLLASLKDFDLKAYQFNRL